MELVGEDPAARIKVSSPDGDGFAGAFTRDGRRLDLDRLAGMLDALDGLLRAGMVTHA